MAAKKKKAPELNLLLFDPVRLLKSIRADFPTIRLKQLHIFMQTQPALASISYATDSAVIQIHSVLNHPDTPKEVITFVIKHELLHLVIPAREVGGKITSHPLEFYEAERSLCPERVIAWSWLKIVLHSCLKFDKKNESTFVKTNWKRLMQGERPTLDQLTRLFENNILKPEEEPLI